MFWRKWFKKKEDDEMTMRDHLSFTMDEVEKARHLLFTETDLNRRMIQNCVSDLMAINTRYLYLDEALAEAITGAMIARREMLSRMSENTRVINGLTYILAGGTFPVETEITTTLEGEAELNIEEIVPGGKLVVTFGDESNQTILCADSEEPVAPALVPEESEEDEYEPRLSSGKSHLAGTSEV